MKKIYNLKITLLIAFFGISLTGMAQSTITGVIRDGETNEPLIGATVSIDGTTIGTTTDIDGSFKLTSSQPLPWYLTFRYVGYSSSKLSVQSEAAGQNLSISLQVDALLDEVVVSASRKPQKIQEAPSSVSVISAKELEVSAQGADPLRQLINTPGVQLQQQSANSINIEMRAGSGIFGTGTFIMLDYRFMVSPSVGTFLPFQSGLNNIDLAKIEVVRGAASALYGPGVTSGVVHFMSKSPIDYQGSTIEVFGGELNTLGAAGRYAWANEDETFGFKVNAKYMRGNDFTFDSKDDVAYTSEFAKNIYEPVIVNNVVYGGQKGAQLLTTNDLDPDGDSIRLRNDYENYFVNTTLEFRPIDDLYATVAGGVNVGEGVFFNSTGAGFTGGANYWAQTRLEWKGFFAQVFYDYNNGGTTRNPTYLMATGFRQRAERTSIEAQLQYNFDLPSLLNSNFTVGMDYRNSVLNSDNTLYGRNDGRNDYIITGTYAQGTFELTDYLNLTVAGRYDRFSFINDGAFAPRAALVYKINPKHTIRASYNKATFVPAALETYIDFPVNVPAEGVFDIWLAGLSEEQGFAENADIDVSIPGVANLPEGTPGLPLAVPYAAVKTDVLNLLNPGLENAAMNTVLQGLGVTLEQYLMSLGNADGTATEILTSFFSDENAYSPSTYTGTFMPYNAIADGEKIASGQISQVTPFTNWEGTGSAQIGTMESWEIGYKGLFGKNLGVMLDLYTYERTGFTQYMSLAPSYALVNDAENALHSGTGEDLGNTIGEAYESYLNQELQDAGVNASIAALIAAGFAAEVNNAFTSGGEAFDNSEAALLYPIIGAIESERAPQGDGITHSAAGYRTYGDATRSHWGMDFGLEYYFSKDITIWGNYSYVSQNEWIVGEDNDDDLPFNNYLNAPKNKFRLGVRYTPDLAWNGSLSFQHDDSFYANVGDFSGNTDTKNLFDASVGYNFTNGLSFNVAGQNVLGRKYRAFPKMPVIGRRVLLRAIYNF